MELTSSDPFTSLPAGGSGRSGRTCDQFDRARCPLRRRRPRTSRAPLRPAAIWPPGMPASSATRPRPRSTTARRCAAIRAIAKFSIGRSSPSWPTARSTKRPSSPSASCRSTGTIASRGSCSACAHSSRSSIRPRAASWPSRFAARSPIWPPRCLAAWTQATPGEAKVAVDSIDKLSGADWYAIFKDLHAGLLILDVAGQRKEAAKRYERAYKLDPSALRVVQAYGSFLSRQGNRDEALKVFAAFDESLPRHPLIVESDGRAQGRQAVADDGRHARRPAPPRCCTASVPRSVGAAERTSVSSTCSLRSISCRSIRWRLLSLADLYEAIKKPELAIKTYERVPLSFAASAQRADPVGDRARHPRPRRRGEGQPGKAHRRQSEGSRSDHGARQRPARAQAVRRMRRRLYEGHRHAHQGREVELGDLLFPRHLPGACQAVAARPRPTSRRRSSSSPTSRMC